MESGLPKLLSSKPKGEDKFEGKSQDKIASIIANLILENRLERKVIGLEGEWGSGKSNVIEIVKGLIGNKYYTYIFDAWGNQEDLTRRTFLEEIIDNLIEENFLTDREFWKTKKNELLAKKSVTNRHIFPKIKPYWILISLATILYLILQGFYNNVLESIDIFPGWYAKFWKPIVSIYLLPAGLLLTGVILALREYVSERKANKLKKALDQETRFQTLSRIFYWLSGDNIESEELENVIEEEPSAREFRTYLSLIQGRIGEKGLVVVFDNIDRLEKDKVRALWSSIHTFFAEHSYKKTWVIVPYYKEKLSEIFEEANNEDNTSGKGFIEKTFSVSFHVSPPVVSDWQNLLKEKISESFGSKIIPKDEENIIITLFDLFIKEQTIKPRQIISYVNELAVIYSIWKEEVDSKKISFRYLALYVLAKDKLLKNPVDSILNKEYLGAAAHIFRDDQNLDNNISALVFNVKKELADEVLLKRELIQAIRAGNIEAIEKSKSHSAFNKYFQDSFVEVDFETKRDHLDVIIESVSEKLPKATIASYWDDFSENVISSKDSFSDFSGELKVLLKKTNVSRRKSIVKELLAYHRKDLSSDQQQRRYYEILSQLQGFVIDNSIKINLRDYLEEVEVEPLVFLHIISSEGKDFSKLKIKCDQESLFSVFYDNETVNINQIHPHTDSLKLLTDYFNFEELIEDVESFIGSLSVNDFETIERGISVLKEIGEKPLSIEMTPTFYNQLNQTHEDEVAFLDVLAIVISNFSVASGYPPSIQLLNSLEEERIDDLAEIIEWYISYGDLLKLIISNTNAAKIANLIRLAENLTTNSYGISILSIGWALKNFSTICRIVFKDDPSLTDEFVLKLSLWNKFYNKGLFEQVDSSLFNHFDKQDNRLIREISKDSLEFVNNQSQETLLSSFQDRDRLYLIIESLIEQDLLTKFTNQFYIAYDMYLTSIVDGSFPIPDDEKFSIMIPDKMDGRKLKGIFTRIRDKVLENPQRVGADGIDYFIDNLISHGNLDKEPERVTYKLLSYLFETEESINKIFCKHLDFFIDSIKRAGEYSEDARIKIASNLDKVHDEEVKAKLLESLNLEQT